MKNSKKIKFALVFNGVRVKPEEKKIKNIRKEREAARQRKAYKF